MALHLGYDELRTASVEVPSAVLVARLLDGGWQGPAASAFADAWCSWLDGLDAVRSSLEALTAGLATTEAAAAATDSSVSDSLAVLQGRLG